MALTVNHQFMMTMGDHPDRHLDIWDGDEFLGHIPISELFVMATERSWSTRESVIRFDHGEEKKECR